HREEHCLPAGSPVEHARRSDRRLEQRVHRRFGDERNCCADGMVRPASRAATPYRVRSGQTLNFRNLDLRQEPSRVVGESIRALCPHCGCKPYNEGDNAMSPAYPFVRIAGALAIAAMAFAPAAHAAWEPTKPVEFVVPAGTGGGADQMARL